MVVNQENLRGLNVSYSTAFNKEFESTETPTSIRSVTVSLR